MQRGCAGRCWSCFHKGRVVSWTRRRSDFDASRRCANYPACVWLRQGGCDGLCKACSSNGQRNLQRRMRRQRASQGGISEPLQPSDRFKAFSERVIDDRASGLKAWTSIDDREDVRHLHELEQELHDSRVALRDRLVWHSLLKMVPRQGPIRAVSRRVRRPCTKTSAAKVAATIARKFYAWEIESNQFSTPDRGSGITLLFFWRGCKSQRKGNTTWDGLNSTCG